MARANTFGFAAAPPKINVEAMFGDIVGYDDLKRQLQRTLDGPAPVHWLLHGPPGTAKTMFLGEIATLPGAYYILGSQVSKAGMSEIVLERRPRYLVIDEIEKTLRGNLATLLSLMETGIVKVDKGGDHRAALLSSSQVIAAANRIDNLPPELLSRFLKVHIAPYSQRDFLKVVARVLEREGVALSTCQAIAIRLWNAGLTDVRQARNVARLAGADKRAINEAIEFVQKYQE